MSKSYVNRIMPLLVVFVCLPPVSERSVGKGMSPIIDLTGLDGPVSSSWDLEGTRSCLGSLATSELGPGSVTVATLLVQVADVGHGCSLGLTDARVILSTGAAVSLGNCQPLAIRVGDD